MRGVSISAMKPSGSGGTDLVRCLHPKSGKGGCNNFDYTPTGDGNLMRFFVKINGVQHYLWRAVDHEGEVLESYVTQGRGRTAALKFLKKAMKRHGSPEVVVTDRLRSYGAAMKAIGNADLQETGRWKNNRAENFHLPFRRRERAMYRFRRMRSLQKFVSIHACVFNHFNQDHSLSQRCRFKLNRSVALAEWRGLCAA